MDRTRIAGLVTIAFAVAGCGAAQLAMKGPITNQCSSSGLKGCPDLTDGVMEYIGGDKAVAEQKLRAAAAANSPEKLRMFARALDPIGSSIGGDAGAALKSVAAILDPTLDDAPTAKASGEPTTAAGKRSPGGTDRDGGRTAVAALATRPASPTVVVEELRAGTERLATDPRAATCGGIFGSDPKCARVRVFVGPLVVTNAYTSGGCPDELFLIAGRLEKPHWILLDPAGAAMNVSGQFILEDGEELFAGVRASAGTPKDDVKCSITWSGFRPISAAANNYGRGLAP